MSGVAVVGVGVLNVRLALELPEMLLLGFLVHRYDDDDDDDDN
jgi:hypothetical protein